MNRHLVILLRKLTRRTPRAAFRFFLILTDALLLWLALRLGYSLRFYWEGLTHIFPVTKGIPPLEIYYRLELVGIAAFLFCFSLMGMYKRLNLPALDELIRLFYAILFGLGVIMAAAFIDRAAEYSRLVLAISSSLALVLVFSSRETVKLSYGWLVTNILEPQNVLVLGSGRMSKSIIQLLRRHPELRPQQETIREPAALKQYIRHHHVQEVFVGEPDIPHKTLIAMAEICDSFKIPFRIVPDVLELRMGEVIVDDSLGLPTFQIKPVSLHGWTFFFKRLTDVFLASVVLSVFTLPLLFIAMLIKLDSAGPIFYKQPRMGHRRRPFYFFKFRSMRNDADRFLDELKKKSERSGPVFKMKDDPRVTHIGRFLRRYSLDEMPQIINVLRGEMSLVGPRPQVLWEASAYDEWARKRLNVLPGITGLWQISGRAQLSYEQMIELDIYYIEHWSPGLDLKIMLRTIPAVLEGKGAY
ncbi:MAG TPA: sugar transferase [Elusimicrobiota bacterium]|nr:sugar transferase [Elusimicrobiota bacterium]